MSVINLRQARKRRARLEKSARGTERAVRFGQTATTRLAEADAQARHARALDQHRRERADHKEDGDGS